MGIRGAEVNTISRKNQLCPQEWVHFFEIKYLYLTLKELDYNFLYQFRVSFLYAPDLKSCAKLRAFVQKYRINNHKQMKCIRAGNKAHKYGNQ